jgi:hypothetical protein
MRRGAEYYDLMPANFIPDSPEVYLLPQKIRKRVSRAQGKQLIRSVKGVRTTGSARSSGVEFPMNWCWSG